MQGKGLSKAILEAGLKEFGRKPVLLFVRESNAVAIHLYEKYGFRVTGRRPRFYASGEDALVMRKG